MSELLRSVLDATRTRERDSGTRLERFLERGHPWEALAVWLELEPGSKPPARERIQRRLVMDIAAIDALLSDQVNAILHHPRFQALESSWRGLAHLSEQAEEGQNVKLRVLDVSWRELARDLERAIEFDQSQLFKKVYSAEFGTPGGEPFGVLLGDYLVRHRPTPANPVDDVGTLRAISQVAAAAFAPFLTGADPLLFGLESFADLDRPMNLARSFGGPEHVQWNALRRSEDARFVGLVLPRVLGRLPWRDDPRRRDGFRFRERCGAADRSGYLWTNAVYAFGGVMVRSFTESGWLAGIRGVERDVEGGGLVTTLPVEDFGTDAPGVASKSSTEVIVTDTMEKELSDLGFIPLCHCHDTPFCAFYGAQSLQSPKHYDQPEAAVNAKLSAMLHYILCASRFAHYLKVIGRDRTGSFSTAAEVEEYLNRWLLDYATSNEDIADELQAQYPLREARARVREVPGKPGVFLSEIHLRPHFQLDQMTTAVKLVTELITGVGAA